MVEAVDSCNTAVDGTFGKEAIAADNITAFTRGSARAQHPTASCKMVVDRLRGLELEDYMQVKARASTNECCFLRVVVEFSY